MCSWDGRTGKEEEKERKADKNSCPGAQAGACLEDDGLRTERERRRRRRRKEKTLSPGPVHLYGLRPEFGLVRGGRGATGAGGQKIVCKEKERGEE
ncbi:hypothetical protein PAMA_021012 [Pampus argenteus]